MPDFVSVLLERYGSVLIGLVIGTLTHFAGPVATGENIGMRRVIAYFMQLGFIGLVAVVSMNFLNITNEELKVFITSVLAISAQEVIQYIKANGWKNILYKMIPRPEDENK